jgi:hypothetical protein
MLEITVIVLLMYVYYHISAYIIFDGWYTNFIEELLDAGPFACVFQFILFGIGYYFEIHPIVILILGLLPFYIIMKFLANMGAFITDGSN